MIPSPFCGRHYPVGSGEWQPTSEDGNSYPRSAGRWSHGRAQRALAKVPVVGFLGVSSLEKMGGGVLLDFKRGLARTGCVEDRNVVIEYRWRKTTTIDFRLATELVRRQDAPSSRLAARQQCRPKATAVIPIVFMIGSIPVELGLVAALIARAAISYGVAYLNDEIAPKRLGLLREVIPHNQVDRTAGQPAQSAAAAAAATKELQGVVETLGSTFDGCESQQRT